MDTLRTLVPFVRRWPRPFAARGRAIAPADTKKEREGALRDVLKTCIQRNSLPSLEALCRPAHVRRGQWPRTASPSHAEDTHWWDSIFKPHLKEKTESVQRVLSAEDAQMALLEPYMLLNRSPPGSVFRTGRTPKPVERFAIADGGSAQQRPPRRSVFAAPPDVPLARETLVAMQQTPVDHRVFWKSSPFVRGSCKKMTFLVGQLKGLPLDAAILQMHASKKKLAQTVLAVLVRLRAAVRAAAAAHGLPSDTDREFCVGTAVSGRGTYLRRLLIRARGRCDIMRRSHVMVRIAAYRPDPLAVAQRVLHARTLRHREQRALARRLDY